MWCVMNIMDDHCLLRAIAWFKTNVFSVECSAAVSRYRNLAVFFDVQNENWTIKPWKKRSQQKYFCRGDKQIAIVLKCSKTFFEAVKKCWVQNAPSRVSKTFKHLAGGFKDFLMFTPKIGGRFPF